MKNIRFDLTPNDYQTGHPLNEELRSVDENFKELSSTRRELVTYLQLKEKIDSSSLISGQKYEITDFATRHYFLDGDSTILTDTHTGATEHIIVTASSKNTLEPIAYSVDYPQDILYYDWNPLNWERDRSFSDIDTAEGDITMIPDWKGVIYKREDTKQNNILHYDFRNVKYRRWTLKPADWSIGTTYAKGAWVKDGDYLYVSTKAGNVGNLTSDTEWWVKVVDVSVTTYWSWNSLECNGCVVDNTDYVDVYTFANYLTAGGNTIGNKTNFSNITTPFTIHSNIVFLKNGTSNGYEIFSNTIRGGFNQGNVTIGNHFRYNDIGQYFNKCIIGDYFYSNKVGNDFRENNIFNYFHSNNVGENFRFNSVSTYFRYNVVNNDSNSNIIGTYFQYVWGVFIGINFSTASHVYADYNCEIVKAEGKAYKLKYVDDLGVEQIVDATA